MPRLPPPSRPFTRTALSEQTYEELKERILDQTLAPGSRLNIDALSRSLKVSSSPLREALARLVSDRLVVSELYSGYTVAPGPTPKYFGDMLDMRIVLEGHCALVGAPKRLPKVLRTMTQAMEKMTGVRKFGPRYRDYRKFVQADTDFHQALIDSAENEAISQTYANLHLMLLQARLYLHRKGSPGTAFTEVRDEHNAVLTAFQAGDGVAARDAVRNHLEGGRRRLLSAAEAYADADLQLEDRFAAAAPPAPG
jgi:DNA-binding GntR family transcriptional regulator